MPHTCKTTRSASDMRDSMTLLPGPQLLLDDLIVEDRILLTRVLQHPEKHPGHPILVRDTPWEGSTQQIRMVLHDPELGRYRMWYGSAFRRKHAQVRGAQSYQTMSYAESKDGYHWQKPTFEFCPLDDHPMTNILLWGQGKPILNPDTSDPTRRFLAAGLQFHDHSPGVRNDGVNLLHSADGLRWHMDARWHLFDHHSDTKNQLIYDASRSRWLLYCRPAITASGRTGHGDHRRRVSVMLSDDLADWTYPETVFYPDEQDAPDIDHVQVFRYGSHLLMFYAAMDSTTTGRMHLRLASSGDGIHWTRFHTCEDFIPLGDPGAYDAGIVGAASPPVRVDDRLLIYYNAMNYGQVEQRAAPEPWVGVGAVSHLPVDRFVAQRAGDEPGWLLTRRFVLQGNTLSLNFAARPHGSVQVEVVRQPARDGHTDYYLAEHGRKGYTFSYDGFELEKCPPLTGDHLDQRVTWHGRDLSALVGQPVSLRFRVQDADLFGFTVSHRS